MVVVVLEVGVAPLDPSLDISNTSQRQSQPHRTTNETTNTTEPPPNHHRPASPYHHPDNRSSPRRELNRSPPHPLSTTTHFRELLHTHRPPTMATPSRPGSSLSNASSASEKEDMWSSMLSSVASSKRLPQKNLLVLGPPLPPAPNPPHSNTSQAAPPKPSESSSSRSTPPRNQRNRPRWRTPSRWATPTSMSSTPTTKTSSRAWACTSYRSPPRRSSHCCARYSLPPHYRKHWL